MPLNSNQTGSSKKSFLGRLAASPLYVKILLAVLVLVLIAAGVVAYLYSQVAGVFDTGDAGSLSQLTDEDIEANGERFYNLLLVGIDYDSDDEGRDYAEGKGMTDVILYVQIDRDKDSINVLQIPRDSYVGEYIAEGVPGNTG